MAKLTSKEKIVKSYMLELTEEELIMIYSLVGSVGGNGPYRDIANGLYRTISENNNWDYKDHSRLSMVMGSVEAKKRKD